MKPENDTPQKNGCLPPIISICVVGGVLFIADLLEKEEKGLGRLFFGSLVGLIFVAVIIWLLVGKSTQETVSNIKRTLKGLGILVLAVVVLGPITNCIGDRSSPTDIYFRR